MKHLYYKIVQRKGSNYIIDNSKRNVLLFSAEKPHNPMVNSGSNIVNSLTQTQTMYKPEMSVAKKFFSHLLFWKSTKYIGFPGIMEQNEIKRADSTFLWIFLVRSRWQRNFWRNRMQSDLSGRNLLSLDRETPSTFFHWAKEFKR